MPVALAPVRFFLGVLGVCFCYWLGRAVSARVDGTGKNPAVVRWSLRVMVAALGTVWGALDWVSITFLALAVLSSGAGFVAGQRPKKPAEDLTKLLFPDR